MFSKYLAKEITKMAEILSTMLESNILWESLYFTFSAVLSSNIYFLVDKMFSSFLIYQKLINFFLDKAECILCPTQPFA